MKKRMIYSEAAYVLGVIILAFSNMLMERADLGMSMVVAPPYIIHLKVSQYLPFFTFGMAAYTFQAVLILLTTIVMRRFKLSYFFSFVTAVFFGVTLDVIMFITQPIPDGGIALRIVFYLVGMIFCSLGVALLFYTYISPEAYELFVKEVSGKFGVNIFRFKTGYDCASCVLGIILSFAFFGLWHFEGVKIGTIVCALLNGYIISLWAKLIDRHFEFKDALPMRKYF